MSNLSPGWRLWAAAKKEHPGRVVLVRMGPTQEDFFEAFGKDAHTLVKVLGLTLSSRLEPGTGRRIPMAGFPVHTLQKNARRLLDAGHLLVVEHWETTETEAPREQSIR